MGFLSRHVALLAAMLFVVTHPAAGQEKPIEPGELDRSGSRFGLQINGFAAGDFHYRFANDENGFGGSTLAVSLFRALSDRISLFGQVTVSQEEENPFATDPSSIRLYRPSSFGGLTVRQTDAANPNHFQTDIDNLQVSWAASPQHGLSLLIGKFDSPLAIERDDAPLNFQATPSFVFQFARPVKFTGLAVRETFSSRLEGFAILTNGWDVSRDNNRAKTGALYGVWSPWTIAHFGVGVIYGAEKDNRTGDPRTTTIATILVQQSPSWVWGEEFVYGREPHSAPDGGSARWFGDMFFTHHRLGRHWALTLRTDYFDDIDGARTGRRQVLRSFTFSPQYLIGGGFFGVYRYLDRTSLRIPELALRLDLRYDRSTEPVFAGRDDDIRRDSPSATLQVVYVF